ncbi:hypothetical protein Pcinc_016611 [Petrolisthes cinctipes]|uniref:C3H1-type domain-containing protein n=1 Tax=Petrolisthes cinctipes TaxID=88211 RepID=A0AAE1FS49_PETCI|nr:hypothetical protein Pcinc_016611 [Petrolisthes cinctipes]
MSIRTALPPPGVKCKTCTKDCVIECVKCDKCNGYFHATCSHLSVYCLVYYFNSRSQYICDGCLSDKLGVEKYGEQHAWVTDLLERDNIPPLKSSEPDIKFPEQSESSQNEQTQDPIPPIPPSLDDNMTKPPPICRFYQRNVFQGCRTGRHGKGCNYEHPVVCWRYLNHGPNNAKGCRLGKKCPKYHPLLCRTAVSTGECHKKDCKFNHLKGTKHTKHTKMPTPINNAGTDKNGIEAMILPQPPETSSWRTQPTTGQNNSGLLSQGLGGGPNVNNNVNNTSFLGLQREIQQLQTQMLHFPKMMQIQMGWPPLQGPPPVPWNYNQALQVPYMMK